MSPDMSYLWAVVWLAVIGIVLWVANHILNLYADRLVKRHEATADRHLDRVASRAKGRMRWVAVFFGSALSANPKPGSADPNQVAPQTEVSSPMPAEPEPQAPTLRRSMYTSDFVPLNIKVLRGPRVEGLRSRFRTQGKRNIEDIALLCPCCENPLEYSVPSGRISNQGYVGCRQCDFMAKLFSPEGFVGDEVKRYLLRKLTTGAWREAVLEQLSRKGMTTSD